MCVTITGAKKVRTGFGPGDHVFGKISVIMSLRAFILPDGADHLEDVIAIRTGKSLIENTKSGQAFTLFTPKVMAAEDELREETLQKPLLRNISSSADGTKRQNGLFATATCFR